ncbi:MAG: NADH-quinone oxidoreductase subunit NuoF [Eubacteriales bacterium]|nr:NADH-quinone oxidoreductase subunit NuoF [Eubacteriales bacterium]
MKIENRVRLKQFRAECQQKHSELKCHILVCGGTGCLAGGSEALYQRMLELTAGLDNVDVKIGDEAHTGVHKSEDIGVHKSGCHGFCEMGPLVRIEPYGYLYLKVKLEDCDEIFEKTVLGGLPVERLMYHEGDKVFRSQEEIPFYARQTRLVLKNCGHIDAEHIEEAIAVGAYKGFEKALFEMTPDAVIKTVFDSKLRGRGGAGFVAGKKWQQVASQKETIRYVVCNGDEGDPGAFMDRSVMEGDPHRMIEGMMIAAYAVGAQEGYIYVRAEYPLAIQRLKIAIAQAEEYGLLGDNILGTGFSFRLHINRGAGAFVCGEGSALTASIEGKRGMPRVKPPRTVEQGLFGKPTVLNNVETYANVSMIILNGAEWYANIGTPNSPGTKAFALTGNVKNTGLIEVPMGISLREIVFDIGGGIPNGKKFKAVQIGGPSGGCLITEQLDVSMDFDSLTKLGAMIGSGGLVVMDEDSCMVEVARFFMSFTQKESCGKCVPCREGTKRMLEILERIVAGNGKMEDIDTLRQLADVVGNAALCGLGKSAPKPVVSTLNGFMDEYIAHIRDHRCPSGVCSKLRVYKIDPELCKGCSKCARNCPAGAITGVIKSPFSIDTDKCIKCGACVDQCAFHAVYIEK